MTGTMEKRQLSDPAVFAIVGVSLVGFIVLLGLVLNMIRVRGMWSRWRARRKQRESDVEAVNLRPLQLRNAAPNTVHPPAPGPPAHAPAAHATPVQAAPAQTAPGPSIPTVNQTQVPWAGNPRKKYNERLVANLGKPAPGRAGPQR